MYKTDPNNRRVVNQRTGEIRERRADLDAHPYHTNLGSGVGQQWVIASTRNPHPGERIILTVTPQPRNSRGNDAHTFTNTITRLANQHNLPIQAAIYDMALSARDYQQLLQAGILAVSRVKRHRNNRIATRNLGHHNFKPASTPGRIQFGTTTQQVTAINGTPCLTLPDDTSKTWLIPLQRKRTRIRHNQHKPAAVYVTWQTPTNPLTITAGLANTTTIIRHDNQPNTALRIIPETDPDFDRLYGLREDVEAINGHIKARLPNKRARSVGTKRQQLNLSTYQLSTAITCLINHQTRTHKNTPLLTN